MSLKLLVAGIPRTKGGLEKDTAIHWVVTVFIGDQGLRLAKLEETQGLITEVLSWRSEGKDKN